MVDSEGRNLIFILSTPRAGSTLLGSILGNHSKTLCPAEPWLLLPLSALHSENTVVVSRYDHDLAREAWRQWIDNELYGRAAGAFATTVYNALLAQAKKEVFVDKTPRYYHLLPWLDAVFPSALKVWLKRNPLDVIASCKETWDLQIAEFVGHIASPFSFDTTVSFALLLAYFEASAPTKYTLRYEDLVQNPTPCVEALCHFVGLPFEDGMLTYGANSALMQMHAEKPMGDKKILEHTAPHPNSVGRWREVLTREELKRVLVTLGSDLFVRMGYGDLIGEATARAGLTPREISGPGQFAQLFGMYAQYVDQGLLGSGGVQHTRIARDNARLRARLVENEADRGARLEVINRLGEQLQVGEADRAARLEVITQLNAQLQASEADRAARLEIVHTQERRLGEIEEERQRVQAELVELQQRFAEMEADRMLQLRKIAIERDDLESQLSGLRQQLARAQADHERSLEKLAAGREDLEAEVEQLRSALHSLWSALQALCDGRIYRLLRKLGRWEWLERTLSQVAPLVGNDAATRMHNSRHYNDTSRSDAKLKRIAVDLTPVLPGGENGGAKLVATELVRHLSRVAPDCEFILLTAERNHEELAFLDSPNVRRLSVASQSVSSSSRTGGLRWLKMQLRPWLASRLPQSTVARLKSASRIVISSVRKSTLPREVGADLLFCPFTAPLFFDPTVPVVSVVHDLQYLSYPQFFSPDDRRHRDQHFREACRLASRLICVSDYVRGTVLKSARLDAEQVITVHTRLFDRLERRSSEQVAPTLGRLGLSAGRFLLYPANFWPHKNHRMLMTAFGMYRARRPQSDLKLVCIGAPDTHMEFLDKSARRMGLQEWLLFPGYMPEDEFVALLQSCQAVIFPSLYEGFGMPVLEAMAFGKPVLCSNVTSLPEVAGEAALFFDPRKPTEIVRAIEQIEADPALVARLTEHGRQRVAAFGDSSRMAQQYWQVFHEAVHGSRYFSQAVHGVYRDGWTSEQVVITYGASPTQRHAEIDLAVPPWIPFERVSVQVLPGGPGPVATHHIDRGQAMTIRHALAAHDGFIELRLEPVFQPQTYGINKDTRMLGCLCQGCRIISPGQTVELLAGRE